MKLTPSQKRVIYNELKYNADRKLFFIQADKLHFHEWGGGWSGKAYSKNTIGIRGGFNYGGHVIADENQWQEHVAMHSHHAVTLENLNAD